MFRAAGHFSGHIPDSRASVRKNLLRYLVIPCITTQYTPILCQIFGPTLCAVDAAGAAHGLSAIYAPGTVPPAVPILMPASGAPDAVRWAASEEPPSTLALLPDGRSRTRRTYPDNRTPNSQAYSGHIRATEQPNIRTPEQPDIRAIEQPDNGMISQGASVWTGNQTRTDSLKYASAP